MAIKTICPASFSILTRNSSKFLPDTTYHFGSFISIGRGYTGCCIGTRTSIVLISTSRGCFGNKLQPLIISIKLKTGISFETVEYIFCRIVHPWFNKAWFSSSKFRQVMSAKNVKVSCHLCFNNSIL